MRVQKLLSLGLLAGVVSGLAACGNSSTTTFSSAPFSARAIHASPDAPTVDVVANDTKAFAGISFFSVSPFQSFPAGDVTLSVFPATAGSTIPTGAPVISKTLTGVPAGSSFSIAVGGLLTPASGQQPLDIFAFPDDLTPTAGSAEIRILHLSPDAPNVDVLLVAAGAPATGSRQVVNLAYGNATANLVVPPGTYDAYVFGNGGTTPVFSAPGVSVEAGKIYTVSAKGLLGGSGATAFGLDVQVDN